VPADYQKIREENIARYGWDTAVLDLLGQLYSERTHFIFELVQNAEDAGATELAFELFADRLELRHDGRPFTEADVRGVCGVGKSAKSGDLTAIGKFGIGFKSVYAYTRSPRIYSGDEHFGIENYVRPFPVEALALPSGGTLFVFPFDPRHGARRGRGPGDRGGADHGPAADPAVPAEHRAAAGGRHRDAALGHRAVGRRVADRGRARTPGGSRCPGTTGRPRSGWPGTAGRWRRHRRSRSPSGSRQAAWCPLRAPR